MTTSTNPQNIKLGGDVLNKTVRHPSERAVVDDLVDLNDHAEDFYRCPACGGAYMTVIPIPERFRQAIHAQLTAHLRAYGASQDRPADCTRWDLGEVFSPRSIAVTASVVRDAGLPPAHFVAKVASVISDLAALGLLDDIQDAIRAGIGFGGLAGAYSCRCRNARAMEC